MPELIRAPHHRVADHRASRTSTVRAVLLGLTLATLSACQKPAEPSLPDLVGAEAIVQQELTKRLATVRSEPKTRQVGSLRHGTGCPWLPR